MANSAEVQAKFQRFCNQVDAVERITTSNALSVTIAGVTYKTFAGYAAEFATQINALPTIDTMTDEHKFLTVDTGVARWHYRPDFTGAGYDGSTERNFPEGNFGQYLRFDYVTGNSGTTRLVNRFLPRFNLLGLDDNTSSALTLNRYFSVVIDQDPDDNAVGILSSESFTTSFNRLVDANTQMASLDSTIASDMSGYVATLNSVANQITFVDPMTLMTMGGGDGGGTGLTFTAADNGKFLQVESEAAAYKFIPSWEHAGFDDDQDAFFSDTLDGRIITLGTTSQVSGRSVLINQTFTTLLNTVMGDTSKLRQLGDTTTTENIAAANDLLMVGSDRNNITTASFVTLANRDLFGSENDNQLSVANIGDVLIVGTETIDGETVPRIHLSGMVSGGVDTVFYGLSLSNNAIQVTSGVRTEPFNADDYDIWFLAPMGTMVENREGRLIITLG